MTAQHTPGKLIFGIRGPMAANGDSKAIPKPFDYNGPGYHDNPGLYAEDGTEVVGCGGEYSIFSSGEDARRLVACWNLCVDVPDETLYSGKPLTKIAFEISSEATVGLLAQRDELLAALQAILADGVHCDVVPHLHAKARAAIQKATNKEQA